MDGATKGGGSLEAPMGLKGQNYTEGNAISLFFFEAGNIN